MADVSTNYFRLRFPLLAKELEKQIFNNYIKSIINAKVYFHEWFLVTYNKRCHTNPPKQKTLILKRYLKFQGPETLLH